MKDEYKRRRVIVVSIILISMACVVIINTPGAEKIQQTKQTDTQLNKSPEAINELNKLAVKGRSPKTGYSREQFGNGWVEKNGCDTRNIILNRDLSDVAIDSSCRVIRGKLQDPYTGKLIIFNRGKDTSDDVQIDHVVALSDAWQKGAQKLTYDDRVVFSNDPLELLAVSQVANQQKGDGDAATWLPSNKAFRCEYVSRQIAVKRKYNLWVTQAEHDAILRVLSGCPGQLLPSP